MLQSIFMFAWKRPLTDCTCFSGVSIAICISGLTIAITIPGSSISSLSVIVFEISRLNHKVINYSMENYIIIASGLRKQNEVFNMERSFSPMKCYCDIFIMENSSIVRPGNPHYCFTVFKFLSRSHKL